MLFSKAFISQRHILKYYRSKDVVFVKPFKIIQLWKKKQKMLTDKMGQKSLLKLVDE